MSKFIGPRQLCNAQSEGFRFSSRYARCHHICTRKKNHKKPHRCRCEAQWEDA